MSRQSSSQNGSSPDAVVLISDKPSLKITSGIEIAVRPMRTSNVSIRHLDEAITSRLIILEKRSGPLSAGDTELLSSHVCDGGGLLILLGSHLEDEVLSSVNYLLESFGISANRDSVIRTSFVNGLYHPKEALVVRGCNSQLLENDSKFVYVRGCTLNTQFPALAIASSGPLCYPYFRPIAAIGSRGRGRICVVGSFEMFNHEYIAMESNKAFLLSLVRILMDPSQVAHSSLQVPVRDYRFISDLSQMSDKPFRCWQDFLGPIPRNLMDLADTKLYDGGISAASKLEETRKLIGVENKPLRGIIKPAYTVPGFDLIPIFPLPSLRPILQPPPLELIDLDELMEIPQQRLNRLANECDSSEDLEKFVAEGAKILGINSRDNREILKLICQRIFS